VSATIPASAAPGDAAPVDRSPSRGEPPRIRFRALDVRRAPSGRARATVTLQRIDGRIVEGAADADAGVTGDLRAAAAATLAALAHAHDARRPLTLLGVKSVRAFDRHVVLVQLGTVAAPAAGDTEPTGASTGAPTLVGSAFADDDLMRATVLAVLNASNRVLWAPEPTAPPTPAA
jgi:hypothetical protein